jgi:hypothetical protein
MVGASVAMQGALRVYVAQREEAHVQARDDASLGSGHPTHGLICKNNALLFDQRL